LTKPSLRFSAIKSVKWLVDAPVSNLLQFFAKNIQADKETRLLNRFKTHIKEDSQSEQSIKDEVDVLDEIKDIRDELKIIKMTLDAQAIIDGDISRMDRGSLSTTASGYYYAQSGLGPRIEAVKAMDEAAKQTFDFVGCLVPLYKRLLLIFLLP
jgi:hypothetical protein